VFGPAGAEGVSRPLTDGESVPTDAGRLVALDTPGHTRHHLSYHWPEARALFAGDLLIGRGDTTWVAEYPGCVADYFRSLDRLRSLPLDIIYPAHGPPLTDPAEALERFERHRRHRVRQVERAMESWDEGDIADLLDRVYGDTVPDGLERAAMRSLAALVDHVRGSTEA